MSDGEKRAILRRRRRQGAVGYLGTVLLTLGSISLGVAQFVPDGPLSTRPYLVPLLAWGGAVLSAAGLLVTIWKGPRYARIIQEHREAIERASERSASLGTILDSALRALMDDLDVDFSNARISVYRHKESHFILLDRVSRRQSLEKNGRRYYPDSQGIIGKSWDSGEAVVTRLPEDRKGWEAKCVADYGFTQGEAKQLTMQARSLVGKRIDRSHSIPVGLILLESKAPRGVTGSTLDKISDSPNYRLLSLILQEVVVCLDEQDVDHFRSARRG